MERNVAHLHHSPDSAVGRRLGKQAIAHQHQRARLVNSLDTRTKQLLKSSDKKFHGLIVELLHVVHHSNSDILRSAKIEMRMGSRV